MAEAFQQQVEQSAVTKGSFVWKTDNFLNQTIGYRKSPEFTFGRYNCCLYIPTCFKGFSIDGVRKVDLITVNCLVDAPMFNENTVYKLSLNDRYGKEFLSTKGTIRRENKIIMMVLFIEYLKKYQNELLSEEEILTFHLSWHPRDDTPAHAPPRTFIMSQQDIETKPDLKSEEKPSTLLETLSNDLRSFYESQTDTDCVLRVGETQFPVHRSVLSARSTVFSAMFRHDTSESRTGEVDIRDVEATSMGDILHYVYSGKIRGLSEDTAVRMYTLADRYALMELRDICLQFLMHNLTSDNVCDVAVLAHTHAENILQSRVVEFIEERLDDFEESDNWIEFSKSRPSLALKLVRSAWRASKRHSSKR